MKTNLSSAFNSLLLMLLFTVLCGFFYPMLITAVGATVCPSRSHGSPIYNAQKQIIGSKLIGQNFDSNAYFHPRISYAGKQGYDGLDSKGSTLSATSKELSTITAERIAQYKQINQIPDTELLPSDALFGSASGLDPHISHRNAMLQAGRVALARNAPLSDVYKLIESHTIHPLFTPQKRIYVNVLELNLALDEHYPISKSAK